MGRFFIVAAVVFGSVSAGWAQNTNHSWEVYAQASRTNTDLIFAESAIGFRVGTVWKPEPSFGVVADFALQPDSGSKEHSFTSLLGGPRFYSPEHYRLSGFLQALGGAYRAGVPGQSAHWDYMWGGGTGVDIRLAEHIALRPLEFDLMFIGGDAGPLLTARGSSGIVFSFGR
jgi:hypothetical protein